MGDSAWRHNRGAICGAQVWVNQEETEMNLTQAAHYGYVAEARYLNPAFLYGSTTGVPNPESINTTSASEKKTKTAYTHALWQRIREIFGPVNVQIERVSTGISPEGELYIHQTMPDEKEDGQVQYATIWGQIPPWVYVTAIGGVLLFAIMPNRGRR
jgi:hypothetical protein